MTEATAPALEPAPAQYVRLWADSLSQVLGQVTGAAVACALQAEMPPDFPPAAESDLWAVVTASGGLRGEMTLRLPAATALHLAQALMSEPPTPDAELTADYKDAAIELLRQVSGIVSSAAKARWGEVQLRVELGAAAPSWPAAASFWVQAGEEGPTGMVLEFALSASFVAELRVEKKAPEKPVVESPAPVAAPDLAEGTGALGMLLDVQLTMTMRFGSRQLLLREVLDLSPGAVVELNRRVQEPVDLLLDGRLVARGEVVVIDGNYGLRVTDVSPLGPQGGVPGGAA
jgi:flagellar motor switch protein FliN/FliY